MTAVEAPATGARVGRRLWRCAAPLVATGAVAGLAWAAGLRGFMAAVAAPDSTVEWLGTFEGILLPGLVTGALLGLAEHRRRTGDARGSRWLAAAPLAFLVANPYVPYSIIATGGLGGGAVAVPLMGISGGYALGGRGPRWARAAAGAVPLLGMAGWAAAAGLIGDQLAVTTARGAWVAVLFCASLAVLCLGCSRAFGPVDAGAQRAAPAP